MSAQVLDICRPYQLAVDWSTRVERLLDSVPGPESHLTHEVVNGELVEVVGSFPGATPGGYCYARGSEEELREAAEMLKGAARLLQRVRAREWTRSGNEGQP
jgi:hypothetical protein